jgi:hypothetical protein
MTQDKPPCSHCGRSLMPSEVESMTLRHLSIEEHVLAARAARDAARICDRAGHRAMPTVAFVTATLLVRMVAELFHVSPLAVVAAIHHELAIGLIPPPEDLTPETN